MNPLAIIKEKLNDLSKSKQMLANYILSNWQDVAFLSAGQLARAVGISESVIVRFAVDIGYSGYPDLQEEIQELVKDQLGLVDMYRKTSGESTVVDAVNKVLHNDLKNLTKTLEQCHPEDITAAVDLISSARRIVILASRTTAGPAQVLSIYLNQILGNTQFLTNGIGDIYDHLKNLDSNDLVIGLSFSWHTRYTVEALNFVKKRGCKMLIITDSLGSPLTHLGDANLFCKPDGVSYFLSHVAPIGLINVLLYLVSTKMGERSIKALTEMDEIYKEYYNV